MQHLEPQTIVAITMVALFVIPCIIYAVVELIDDLRSNDES